MICCSAFAASDPTPPRPVVQRARSEGVEPRSFAARGSAPARRSARTAAEHRFRTARCNGVTPPRAAAFGSAPASTRYSMTARCRAGSQFGVPGSPIDGCVQGFRAPAVAGADAGASRHEISSRLTVVSERRGVQRGSAFVDPNVTVVDEELIAARKARRRQRRRGVERCLDERAIARRDRHQQPREILGDGHKARYPAGPPATAAMPFAVIGVLTHLARSARRCLRRWPTRCRWATAASPRVSPATPPAARRAADRSARSCG